jgi:hypothetical protein
MGLNKQDGLNSFVLTPKKWIEGTNIIGLTSKAGRYRVTFSHMESELLNPKETLDKR